LNVKPWLRGIRGANRLRARTREVLADQCLDIPAHQ
jgi:hypothetical protein